MPLASSDDLLASLGRFFVPEQVPSVKLVFDNVRNFLICATLYTAAIAGETKYPAEYLLLPGVSDFTVLKAISIFLFALNLIQVFVLAWRAVDKGTDAARGGSQEPMSKVGFSGFIFVSLLLGTLAMYLLSLAGVLVRAITTSGAI